MGTATAPEKKTKEQTETRKQPPYNVILHDDDDHTFEYVILMLHELFNHSIEMGLKMAEEVHKSGRVIVDTTSLERAELKRDQIHGYGADPRLERSQGSMTATIEPAE